MTITNNFIKITLYTSLHLSVTNSTVKITSWAVHSSTVGSSTVLHATGLIPDGVTGIFHKLNPSNLTTVLGSTQLLTERSSRGIYGGGLRQTMHRAGNLATFICLLSRIYRSFNLLKPTQACIATSYNRSCCRLILIYGYFHSTHK
jgi:hypothetical protein